MFLLKTCLENLGLRLTSLDNFCFPVTMCAEWTAIHWQIHVRWLTARVPPRLSGMHVTGNLSFRTFGEAVSTFKSRRSPGSMSLILVANQKGGDIKKTFLRTTGYASWKNKHKNNTLLLMACHLFHYCATPSNSGPAQNTSCFSWWFNPTEIQFRKCAIKHNDVSSNLLN